MAALRLSLLSIVLLLTFALIPPPVALHAQSGPTADIVDSAVAAGDFTTLVAAVEAAGLVDALKGEGPFTVFAPTDAAFAALPAGTLESLLADPSGDLTQILLYHVVPGQVMAADVTDGLQATTLQGGVVTFTVADGGVKINDANIVVTDIAATNGVIHVIDAVILPPADEEAVAEAAAIAEEPTLLPVTGLGASSTLINSFGAVIATLGALGTGVLVDRRRK